MALGICHIICNFVVTDAKEMLLDMGVKARQMRASTRCSHYSFRFSGIVWQPLTTSDLTKHQVVIR